MTDQNASDIFSGFPARCGGGGAVQHMVVPSFTSRRPQWPFSSTESAPSNECCTSESAAEPSHRCDPNYSSLHPHNHHHHHQQQQVDLSTRPASPRAVPPLSATRDTPGLPSNEDRLYTISAQQQGIAYSPAAAVAADQDFLPFASTIPNGWNKNTSPASSHPNTQGSSFSFEAEFGGSGAPIAPEDFDSTPKNKHLSSRARFSNKCTETPDISEDNDEDHSDGGITVDLSDSEMSSGSVQVLYSSSALPAMDEDEDDFSPNNLVTRPPSPVAGGSSLFMDIFSSPSHERLPEITNGEHPGPYIQLGTLQNGFGPIPNISDVLRPSTELSDSRSQSLSTTPGTPSDIIIDPSPPNVQVTASQDNDELAFFGGEDDESFVVESNYSHPTASMPSQSSSQSPPTASVVPPAPLAAAVVAASGIMAAAAGVGATPSITQAPSTLPPPPHPPLPPPLPPHISRTPSFSLLLDAPTLDGGSIIEDDDFDDLTNHTFEHILILEDIENNNFDFLKFCTHAYCRSSFNSGFPKLFPAAMDIRNIERPQEVTRADVEKNGGDYQGISWERLGITGEAARAIRRKEYVNYRNIRGVDDENLVSFSLFLSLFQA